MYHEHHVISDLRSTINSRGQECLVPVDLRVYKLMV